MNRQKPPQLLTWWKTWTPELAYVLGFAFADGSVRGGNRNSLMFVQKDPQILHAINAVIPGGGAFFPTGRGGTGLRITIHGLPEVLKPYGIVHRKTYVGYWPEFIPPELVMHYIRGFFDGDGYILERKRTEEANEMKRWIFGFTCYVREYLFCLHSELIKRGLSSATIYESRKNWKVKWHSRADIELMYRLLYEGNGIFLPKKKAIFEDAIGYFQENPPYAKNLRLSKEQADEIRNLYSTGDYSFVRLAQRFKVGRTTIEQVVKQRVRSYE